MSTVRAYTSAMAERSSRGSALLVVEIAAKTALASIRVGVIV
jgi:hypothetical protein